MRDEQVKVGVNKKQESLESISGISNLLMDDDISSIVIKSKEIVVDTKKRKDRPRKEDKFNIGSRDEPQKNKKLKVT